MSFHHHHSHQQTIQSHQNASSCCCCCCCSSCSSPPPPPISPPDQLLQALASHLVLQSHPPPPPPKSHPHRQYQQNGTHQHLYQAQAQAQTQAVLHSLFQRVAALESHLPHLSAAAAAATPAPRTPPPPPQPQPVAPPPTPLSLRDVAARTIQSRFRLFLVRRSQTLRHLQRLASIKSHAAALRSSLSDCAPTAASQEAADLLLRLDSIQSRDPMIREGKRSIGRELARVLEFINKVSLRDHQLALGVIEQAENGSDRRRGKPFSAKRVSFAQDVKESTGFRGIGDYSRVLEEPEEMHELSEEEESPRENGVRIGIKKDQTGNFGLSAPAPVYMEPRKS